MFIAYIYSVVWEPHRPLYGFGEGHCPKCSLDPPVVGYGFLLLDVLLTGVDPLSKVTEAVRRQTGRGKGMAREWYMVCKWEG